VNRYFFYMFAMTMLANAIFFVTRILIEYRFEGTVSSLLLAIPIGMAMIYVFVRAIRKFPNQGLPEIMGAVKHRWLASGVIIYFALISMSAGVMVLMVFADITKRYINPDFTPLQAMLLYLIIVIYICRMKSATIIYVLELIIIFSFPFILFIISKTITSEQLWIDSMLEVATFVWKPPSWHSLAAATYVFSGFSNMIIFNRFIKSEIKGWFYIVLLGLFIINLSSSFFIPIGLHGAEGVEEYVYPWFASADSTRFIYGFVERVLFIFLIMYTMISIITAVVYWHVALQLFLHVCPRIPSPWSRISNELLAKWVMLSFFALCAIGFEYFADERELYQVGKAWFSLRFVGDVGLIALLFILGRKRKYETKDT
jgi:hypothetical protein